MITEGLTSLCIARQKFQNSQHNAPTTDVSNILIFWSDNQDIIDIVIIIKNHRHHLFYNLRSETLSSNWAGGGGSCHSDTHIRLSTYSHTHKHTHTHTHQDNKKHKNTKILSHIYEWMTTWNTLMKEIATLLIEDDIDVMSLIGLWWYAQVITHNWFQDWSVMHCIVWVFNVSKSYKRNCGKAWRLYDVCAQCTLYT